MSNTDPNLIFMLFYLTGAILLLAVAILVYPTMRERAKRQNQKK